MRRRFFDLQIDTELPHDVVYSQSGVDTCPDSDALRRRNIVSGDQRARPGAIAIDGRRWAQRTPAGRRGVA